MQPLEYKPILFRLGLLAIVVLLGVGFRAWTSFEKAKSDDIAMASQLSQIRESLHIYFVEHNQYPPLAAGLQLLTVSQTLHCLSDEGFTPLSSPLCEKRDYLPRFKGRYASNELLNPFVYMPLNGDGSHCSSLRGCAEYAIPFEVKTNVLFPKGVHRMTPAGMR